ncbi:GntP family permease [Citricoccus sp. SGAir0253]|uniref:GntP family permease n=1 Tax=Citricoccus sp. SGAir0253 TaxID=2567881 RepID=UPI0010CD38CE|nr:GntP family permease [Citricoccus sp. SGAir0253]QCU78467.1 GntP family permease [Citricoccus sp. SGAir0253]
MLLGILGIILSLALLITLAYRGMPVIIAAPIASVVALVFSGAPILASYTEIFMPALAGFVGNYFPVFLLGAIFGLLMTATGYAESIARTVTRWIGARSALMATVITSALMTYGGISLFVVAFVMFPLARELFRMADIPKRLIPGTIALGIFTFTMTALPGSPQVQNIIPGQFFGTGGFAAPGIGLVGAAMIFGLGLLWLEYRRRTLMAKGEHFADTLDAIDVANGAQATGPVRHGKGVGPGAAVREEERVNAAVDTESNPDAQPTSAAVMTPPNALVPFLPLLVVFIVNFGCTLVLFPALDWSYLSEEKFGGVTLQSRAGIWAVTVALVVAVLVIIALNARHFRELRKAFADGAKGAMLPIFSTGSEVGYGAVVASVAAFAVIRDSVFNLGGSALVTSVVSTSITAAITGSSSGGMTIALNAFGEQLRQMAVDQGVSLEAMHRLTAMAAGGLDTLPHSGAVVTLLIVCGMTHRQSYKDIGMVTLVIPVITVAVLTTVASFTGAF